MRTKHAHLTSWKAPSASARCHVRYFDHRMWAGPRPLVQNRYGRCRAVDDADDTCWPTRKDINASKSTSTNHGGRSHLAAHFQLRHRTRHVSLALLFATSSGGEIPDTATSFVTTVTVRGSGLCSDSRTHAQADVAEPATQRWKDRVPR